MSATKPSNPSASASSSSSEVTRQLLIKAATDLFAAKGFDGTSVKDIAEGAGVNISLVSYHFGGKEGLLKACLEGFGRERLATALRILQQPKTAEEFEVRLKLFVDEFIVYHFEHKEIVQIVHQETGLMRPATCEVFKDTFIEQFNTLVRFLDHGRQLGILRKEVNALILAGHFMGGLIHALKFSSMSEELFNFSLRDPDTRTALIQQTVDVLIRGAGVAKAGAS